MLADLAENSLIPLGGRTGHSVPALVEYAVWRQGFLDKRRE
jgi:hypothetical protein